LNGINHIAFYGTLMSTNTTPVHKEIRNKLQFISKCIIPGKLYEIGRLTALRPGTGSVNGELYEIIDDSILRTLDKYESIDNENPALPAFSRKSVNLQKPTVKVWIYYYDGKI
jgi:gamma-glutamylcyclotransferase (GGCT)/AIG2-like uncharacterized protein YtfP